MIVILKININVKRTILFFISKSVWREIEIKKLLKEFFFLFKRNYDSIWGLFSKTFMKNNVFLKLFSYL